MTLSDTELEATLRRGMHAVADDVPPAHHDLAVLTRDRHRALRRREIGFAGAALAAALVFVGVPVVAHTLASDTDRGQTAVPTPSEERSVSLDLADLPTRGSLAGDVAWLDEVIQLDWLEPEAADVQGALDPPLGTRKVAFAGDVPGARVALVTGEWAQLSWHMWFVGPEGAAPDEMERVATPMETRLGEPVALLDLPRPSSGMAVLVVVAFPGDTAEVLTGRELDASGAGVEKWQPLALTDGVGAAEIPQRAGLLVNGGISVVPAGGPARPVYPEPTPRLLRATSTPDFEFADPRNLAGTVDVAVLQDAGQCLYDYFGTDPEPLGFTVLAAGTVDDTQLGLVGATFPSGATTACLAEQKTEPGAVSMTTSLVAAHPPTGTLLVNEVFAVPAVLSEAIAVSAPASARSAEVLARGGATLTTVPLVDGAGVAPLSPPAPHDVRVLDGAGAEIADVPVDGVGG